MNWKKLEDKWNEIWLKEKVFEANPDKRESYMVTFPYPYVNCSMHIGHLYTFLRCDVDARFRRMNGYNVLFSQGFHATGEPIVSVAKRIIKKDEKQIMALKKSGIPDKEISKFKEPEYVVEYFIKAWKKDLQAMGASLDWRRTFYTTSLNPPYNKFVTWQYNTLKAGGFVTKGSHPIIYCPECKSATGEQDRLKGENATIVDYIVIKFKLNNGTILPAATLRPETVFGVVNMWVNPEVDYAKVKVGKEEWIVSIPCYEKMADQNYRPVKSGLIKGKELLKEKCQNPITNAWVPIYPAEFVDPSNATGVVMSVPTHAPYDYIALKDLGVKFEPIHLIDTPGLGKNPAMKLTDDMGIKNQKEVGKLEEATKHIYKMEFHKGVLNANCGKYKGLKVSECKEQIFGEFVKKGIATVLHECSEEVVCRCTTACRVKLIENQWFLKYSDKKWKKNTLAHLKKMKIYPKEARNWLENSINNMHDKACARKSGLGTPLPWDKEWTIESLSDSTIYMSFYIIQKFVAEGKIKEKNMNDDFFDYVLLNKKVPAVEKKTGLKKAVLDEIRKEFEYYYPVDMRISGKDLLSHHLPFFLLHHVAIFPESKRPLAIAANGYTTVDGQKMSKSLGNFITMRDALDSYGADATRLAASDTAEGLLDADFRRESALNFGKKLNSIMETYKGIKTTRKSSNAEAWLLSVIQNRIKETTKALESMKSRTALQSSFHGLWNDISEYLKATKTYDEDTVKYAFSTFAKLNSVFAPFFCEELWEELGNKGLVSTAEWPKVSRKYINKEVELGFELTENIENDIKDILKLLEREPKKITLFVSRSWKYSVFTKLKELIGKDFRMIMSEMMKSTEAKQHGKDVAGIVESIVKNPSKMPSIIIPKEKELALIKEIISDLKAEFKADVEIIDADTSKDPKAMKAIPFKPGILIE